MAGRGDKALKDRFMEDAEAIPDKACTCAIRKLGDEVGDLVRQFIVMKPKLHKSRTWEWFTSWLKENCDVPDWINSEKLMRHAHRCERKIYEQSKEKPAR